MVLAFWTSIFNSIISTSYFLSPPPVECNAGVAKRLDQTGLLAKSVGQAEGAQGGRARREDDRRGPKEEPLEASSGLQGLNHLESLLEAPRHLYEAPTR